jgi:hypothetical protein
MDQVVAFDLLRTKYHGKLFTAMIDLRKAFPSIPRQRLIEKLASVGISEKVVQ